MIFLAYIGSGQVFGSDEVVRNDSLYVNVAQLSFFKIKRGL